jgi:hypothetical protein
VDETYNNVTKDYSKLVVLAVNTSRGQTSVHILVVVPVEYAVGLLHERKLLGTN